jgi:SAM-dependent methyltransferase
MPPCFEEAYYARNYRNYAAQNPRAKLDFYRGLLEEAAPAEDSTKILEIGCAFGRFLQCVDPAWQRHGCDLSQHAVSKAKQDLPDAKFWVGDAARIPVRTQFNLVAAFDVIEHVPDLAAVGAAVNDALAPEGCFLFVVPVYDGPTGPIIRVLDKDPTHVHKQSRWFWLDWAEERFELLQWWGLYRYLLPTRHYLFLPTKRMRRYTPAIAVLMRKKS